MVCIAAFIILILVSVPVLVLSIIGKRNKKVARMVGPYFKMFKKSWYCVGKRVTLQKCESTFKDEIKNSLLKRVIVKKPKLVKPLGIAIEVTAVLIVLVTIWSLLTAVKGGLALYVYGTCDVSNPSSCSLNVTEACSIDQEKPGFWESAATWQLPQYYANWFGELGEVITAIPSRLKHWDAAEYLPENATYLKSYDKNKPTALEVIDPGCSVCRQSFINITDSDFDDRYNLTYIAYPIPAADGYKFAHSYLVTSYLEAVRLSEIQGDKQTTDWKIIKRMFTEFDAEDRQYQSAFNASYNAEEAERVLQSWLKDFGYTDEQVRETVDIAHSSKVKETIAAHQKIVDSDIKTKKIPTFIYDGRKHDGLLKP
ncbi:MAG: hypothetical protein LBL84_02040 [Candidatus Nomurabacteria bacterium]|jgi:hypothetical protein|nr:hypothetical protein [Candidatus Nomurabacteria bacterium]